MKCYNCGGKNGEKHKYCSYCGVFLQYIPNKVYPNCSTCKWLDDDTYNWKTCSAQGYKNLDDCENIPYGTVQCFGVYELKL